MQRLMKKNTEKEWVGWEEQLDFLWFVDKLETLHGNLSMTCLVKNLNSSIVGSVTTFGQDCLIPYSYPSNGMMIKITALQFKIQIIPT